MPDVQEQQSALKQHTKTANAAIYYHPDGFDTSTPKLMGRQAAGESFLDVFARYNGQCQFYCYAPQKQHAQNFAERIQGRISGEFKVDWVHAQNLYLPTV